MSAALLVYDPLGWVKSILREWMEGQFGGLAWWQWLLLLFLAEVVVAGQLLLGYYTLKAGMWFCHTGARIVSGLCQDVYMAIGWLVVLPFRIFFGPIPLALWLIRRSCYTVPVELVVPTLEDKEEVRNRRVPEMANVNRPLRSAELPACVASLVDADGVHLGFCSLVSLEKGKTVIVTALHVLKEALTQGLGKVHILANGKKHTPFSPAIAFQSNVLDVVGINAPLSLGSALGLKVGAPAIAKAHGVVKVFSPPASSGAEVRCCTGPASHPKAFRIQYSASTVAGSSGSPLMDSNGKIVGVHTYGSLQHGKVVNGGAVNFWKLCSPVRVAETSSKAQDRAEYLDEDFQAGDYDERNGDEEVVDMEYGGEDSRFYIRGTRYRVAPPKAAYVLRGAAWADEEDENACFPRGELKTPALLPTTGSSNQQESPKISPDTERSMRTGRRRRNRKVRSKRQEVSVDSAQTPVGKSPQPSATRGESGPLLRTGMSQSEAQRRNESACSTKRVVFAPLSRPARTSN